MNRTLLTLLAIFFITSCVTRERKVAIKMSKKVPESNRVFLASNTNSNLISDNATPQGQILGKTSIFTGQQPRRNMFARHGSVLLDMDSNLPLQSDKILQENNMVLKQEGGSSDFEKIEYKVKNNKKDKFNIKSNEHLYQKIGETENISQLAANTSKKSAQRSVFLGEYSSEQDALVHAISATRYTGTKFFVEKSSDIFVVKSEKLDKATAYTVANLGLKVGYYNLRVVY